MNPAQTKTAILVDSACDLPAEYIESNDVFIIPINIEFAKERLKDERDEIRTLRFYKKYINQPQADITSRPSSPDQIRNFILKHVAIHYDQALVLCISSTRSDTYKNAMEAKQTLEDIIRGSHAKSQLRLRKIDVIDTRSLFSGQAILAYCAANALKANADLSLDALVAGSVRLVPNVQTYVVLRDLFYARHRARLRNDKTIGGFAYFLGKSLDIKPVLLVQDGETKKHSKARGFDHALEKLFAIAKGDILEGLTVPTVMISYAGKRESLYKKTAYKEFAEYAANSGISLHVSIMSTTGGIYVGPGAISLSYIGKLPRRDQKASNVLVGSQT